VFALIPQGSWSQPLRLSSLRSVVVLARPPKRCYNSGCGGRPTPADAANPRIGRGSEPKARPKRILSRQPLAACGTCDRIRGPALRGWLSSLKSEQWTKPRECDGAAAPAALGQPAPVVTIFVRSGCSVCNGPVGRLDPFRPQRDGRAFVGR